MTTPTADIADDNTTANEAEAQRVIYGLLIAGTIAVAAVTFVISFVGLRDYGIRVMGVPTPLGPLVPIGVDVFSLCGIAATYLLARAPWRVRLYAWAVFLTPAGLSIAGNLAHAEARHLDNAGKAGVAAAPVVLALAAHLLVVIRRHLRRDSVRDSRPTVSEDAAIAEVSPDETLSLQPAEPAAPRRPHNATPDEQRMRALALLDLGSTFDEVAGEVGVTARTVQRWFDARVEEIKARSRAAKRPRREDSDRTESPTTPWPTPPRDVEADLQTSPNGGEAR